MAIKFYSTQDEYGAFSNFAPYPFTLDGKRWPTSEHYFQAQKFAGTKDEAHAEQIRKANSPVIAARMGRSRKVKVRRDWEGVKDGVMRKVVLRKFETHVDIRELLLGTGGETIVEKTADDYYWGCGADGSGKNRLGQILMEVQAVLRERVGADKDEG